MNYKKTKTRLHVYCLSTPFGQLRILLYSICFLAGFRLLSVRKFYPIQSSTMPPNFGTKTKGPWQKCWRTVRKPCEWNQKLHFFLSRPNATSSEAAKEPEISALDATPNSVKLIRRESSPDMALDDSDKDPDVSAASTPINSVKLILGTLSSISQSLPFPGVHLPFDSILALIGRFQVSSRASFIALPIQAD